MRQANSAKIIYASWFSVPRGIMRKDADSPRTVFDKYGSPEMRLYFHLQKVRRPDAEFVEMSNADLMRLVGLPERTFRRARASLVECELITYEAMDGRREM